MSQKKVDQYKKEKANRQQIMKREKMRTRLGVTVAALVMVALIGWFGVSVYQNSKAAADAAKPANTIVLDNSDIDAYINGVTSEAAE